MSKDTSFEARYEGYDIIDYGLAAIPNLLFKHYCNLELSDGHFTLLSHIISRKWTDAPPYPTITHIPMSATVDTRRRYVREMRNKGLIFTARLYWTHKDTEKHPQAKPGKLRANLWYLGNLFHNLERMEQWTTDGNKPEDFAIEVQQATVELYLAGKLNDVPDKIAKLIDDQTNAVGRAIPVLVQWLPEELLCENDIVDIKDDLLCENLVVEKHIVMKKKHESNKNHILKEEEVSPPPKPKPTKKKEPTPKPAAVHAYRSIARRFPDKAIWEMIDQAIGEKQEDIDFWKEVITGYIGQGWNKLNVNGMLDFYKRHEIPGQNGGNRNGQTTTRNGQSGTTGQTSGGKESHIEAYKRENKDHISVGIAALSR